MAQIISAGIEAGSIKDDQAAAENLKALADAKSPEPRPKGKAIVMGAATEAEIKASRELHAQAEQEAAASESKDMAKVRMAIEKLRAHKVEMLKLIEANIRKEAVAQAKELGIEHPDDGQVRPLSESEVARIESVNAILHTQRVLHRTLSIEYYKREVERKAAEVAKLDEKVNAASQQLSAIQHERQKADFVRKELHSRMRGLETAEPLHYMPIGQCANESHKAHLSRLMNK